jgi:phage terminase large subunit-like protein
MLAANSLISSLAALPETERSRILSSLTSDEAERLVYDWELWANPHQLPPGGDWAFWFFCAGRGAGKTRAGAEQIRKWAETGHYKRIGLIAPTAGDVRDVMVEGESGIMNVCPPWMYPKYEPSKRRITWPNGAIAITYSADEPDRLRGPQHDALWIDEPASWRRPETWDMALFGLRLGHDPRAIITGTPRRTKLIKDLMANPRCVTTRGTTYENLHNLAPTFREQILLRYEGTSLGRQELLAELVEDVEGALWKHETIDAYRIMPSDLPPLRRIVVAVDPPGGATECGIVVCGLSDIGHGYVLWDGSIQAKPNVWGLAVVDLYNRFQADRVIGEANYGGDMVENTIRAVDGGKRVAYKQVTATRGKKRRGEPVSALYDRGLVHHAGVFASLEDEMCTWTEEETWSPNRMDAVVWGFTELMGREIIEPRQDRFLR